MARRDTRARRRGDEEPRERPSRTAPGLGARRWAPLLAVLALSLCLNTCNNTFPLGYHGDEQKKVLFIEKGLQDFMHPILMLQLNRIVHAVSSPGSYQDIAVSGRTLNAVIGAFVPVVACLLVDPLQPWRRLLVGVAVAVSPILVVHAHYVKEDILFSLFCLLSVHCLVRALEEPTWRHASALGLATGLACSSKYAGALLFPLYAFAPLQARCSATVGYYRRLSAVCLTAVAVFAAVNYPMFLRDSKFLGGLSFELQHARGGHDVQIHPWRFLFAFHLQNSLLAGMTPYLLVPALAQLVYALWRWREAGTRDRVLAAFVLLFYLAAEISPLKPFPDFMRYMLPIVPPLILLGFDGPWRASRWLGASRVRRVAPLLVSLMMLPPLYDSAQLVRHLVNDTRATAEAAVRATGQKALFERYASAKGDVRSLTELDVDRERAAGVRYLVASSFSYARFALGARLEDQPAEVYRKASLYGKLFALPYREVRPAYRSFAFSNPTVRIIDLGARAATAPERPSP